MAIGVRTVDTAGAGGTSWVAVEAIRASGQDPAAAALGTELWDWGVPTAASVSLLSDLNLQIIATGGLRSGLDVAAAIALGARAGGLAAPVLKAWKAGGYDGAVEYLRGVIETVKAVTFLTGCRTPAELASAPRVIGSTLRAWQEGAR